MELLNSFRLVGPYSLCDAYPARGLSFTSAPAHDCRQPAYGLGRSDLQGDHAVLPFRLTMVGATLVTAVEITDNPRSAKTKAATGGDDTLSSDLDRVRRRG